MYLHIISPPNVYTSSTHIYIGIWVEDLQIIQLLYNFFCSFLSPKFRCALWCVIYYLYELLIWDHLNKWWRNLFFSLSLTFSFYCTLFTIFLFCPNYLLFLSNDVRAAGFGGSVGYKLDSILLNHAFTQLTATPLSSAKSIKSALFFSANGGIVRSALWPKAWEILRYSSGYKMWEGKCVSWDWVWMNSWDLSICAQVLHLSH